MSGKAFKEYLKKQVIFLEEQAMKYDHCSETALLAQLFEEREHEKERYYEKRIASKGFAFKLFLGRISGLFKLERRYDEALRRYFHGEMQAILRTAEHVATAVVSDADTFIVAMKKGDIFHEAGSDSVENILVRMEKNEFLTSLEMIKFNVERLFNDISELSHAKRELGAINEQMKEKEEEILIQKEVLARRVSVARDEGILPASVSS